MNATPQRRSRPSSSLPVAFASASPVPFHLYSLISVKLDPVRFRPVGARVHSCLRERSLCRWMREDGEGVGPFFEAGEQEKAHSWLREHAAQLRRRG